MWHAGLSVSPERDQEHKIFFLSHVQYYNAIHMKWRENEEKTVLECDCGSGWLRQVKQNSHKRRGDQGTKIPHYYKDYHTKISKSLRMTAEIRVGQKVVKQSPKSSRKAGDCLKSHRYQQLVDVKLNILSPKKNSFFFNVMEESTIHLITSQCIRENEVTGFQSQ